MHTIHIPVMGTGFSIDTPIRLAPYGISSVISIMDDILIEKVRKYYCNKFNISFIPITAKAEDSRAKRITAYINLIQKIVQMKFERIKNLPFFEHNEKRKYFNLLPDESSLKIAYNQLLKMSPGEKRIFFEKSLTEKMVMGSIDVNIMVKLDRLPRNKDGDSLPLEYSDGKSALRGYANSDVESSIILSAGINKSLYQYMTGFKDFYRDTKGKIKKKIIIKVSDFRSALIQGKFLAKKGLEIHEFRIESGLNCGGHAFASNGYILPIILNEIQEKRHQLVNSFEPLVQKYYEKKEWDISKYPSPLITVQGGIGTSGEVKRLINDYKIDKVGIATPFLLVPEATCLEKTTFDKLKNIQEEDLYLSDSSPLGVPFNNLRTSVSEENRKRKIKEGIPGSPCPKGFLVSNIEFTEQPICTASSKYQKQKLENLGENTEKDIEVEKIVVKSCLCVDLAHSALISLGIIKEEKGSQAICPGQNITWFKREYSLVEMMQNFYNSKKSLVSKDRPHMFAKEIQMYVDYFENLIQESEFNNRNIKTFNDFFHNLKIGMDYCLYISQKQPYLFENIDSIKTWVQKQEKRLDLIYNQMLNMLPTTL